MSSVPRPHGLPPVPLGELAALLKTPVDPGWAALGVSGITHDSRAVQPGDLFAALPGAQAQGSAFVEQALAHGAVAVLAEEPTGSTVPTLLHDDPRSVLGRLAARVYGDPSRAMTVIGTTGTNGKTTVSYLVEAGLRAAGHRTGLLGTVETRLGDQVLPAVRTTPEAPDLQALLAVAREDGVDAVAMEVSSHALALHRVAATRFAAGVFTNLTQDHLDFHGDMEAYFTAKARLFRPDQSDTAVICVDDAAGLRLLELVRIPQVTYSVTGVGHADWSVSDVVAGPGGSTVRARGPAGEDVLLTVALAGMFNVSNALGALAALVAVGIDAEVAAAGIGRLRGVPGRLEPVEVGQPFTALVDYAHTPAAVAALLATLRPLTTGRLVVVIGAGGDRDAAKRPLMAQAAVAGADFTVFTSDNPRSEDPAAILAALTDGLTGSLTDGRSGDFAVEPDRAIAIAMAVRGLGAGDTVVVAGKGHELGQDIAGVVAPFDDRLVLGAAILAGHDQPAHAPGGSW